MGVPVAESQKESGHTGGHMLQRPGSGRCGHKPRTGHLLTLEEAERTLPGASGASVALQAPYSACWSGGHGEEDKERG